MKKIIYVFISAVALLMSATGLGVASSSFVVNPEDDGATVTAYLFLSDMCPWCRKLKQEGFAAKFKKKYAGKVVLKEYEIHTAQGRQQFSRMTQKYNLSGGVPVLIVGDTVLPGYSQNMLERAGQAMEKERKKKRPSKKSSKKESNLPVVMGITMMEDLQGVAPAEDLEKMKKYLERIQDENGETLNSMNNLFSPAVCNQAMSIVNTHEHKLKDLAAKSSSYAAFEKSAATITAKQQTQLNELMRKNAKSMRR
ncbi:MAG: hypothetical protein MJ053_07420 [Elusimicrobiaceae bacterium]|nr:hypothetical protein [Elusimicrobiaceae bacterium]